MPDEALPLGLAEPLPLIPEPEVDAEPEPEPDAADFSFG